MKSELVEILCCPDCKSDLQLRKEVQVGNQIESGELVCASCANVYQIVNSIPHFVPCSNYADNFGVQWNRYRKTQLDSNTGIPVSEDRFFSFSGWQKEEMAHKNVLDVGCGAGRFTEVALSTGATVFAIDYSSAVEACFENHRDKDNLHVIQADIYRLPFRHGLFDFVYCLGVIQHTPDVKKSFMSLIPPLKTGGRITVDVYPKLFRNVLWSKYWLRPFTKRMSPQKLLPLVEGLVKHLLPVCGILHRIPGVGHLAKYMLPVVSYYGVYPFDHQRHFEWSVLDTFDMFGPEYDRPQTMKTFKAWFEEADLQEVEVFRKGFFVGRAVRKERNGDG